ncbi:hypothetical protein BU23DRAFT_535651 [Bimuria novae-zelandiae CBS 107.79]|uniref:Ubiquitin 3 binding protein But2 C-terminal domain-containing protein n=1 Tax=Bimuria novae-zelandiae CBS 107.79 TaxID=1447943 RepID=A0A6A5V7J1_9PLEO|nr:hypothetical protein BU23DRAFT_535651 [Bimuria novae-zelandiae CBS 107.79]
MWTSALFISLLATVSAASTSLDSRNFLTCPTNPFQPSGKLPYGSVSTSALVQISAKQPYKAFPSSSWAKVTPNDYCTIFNLNLDPAATQGKIRSLLFDFPSILQAPLLYKFNGPSHFTFTGYAIGAGAKEGITTYANKPAAGSSPPNPPKVMLPGHSYVVNSSPCGIPSYIQPPVTVSGSLCSKDTWLEVKQSDVICPLGFYILLRDDLNWKPETGSGH